MIIGYSRCSTADQNLDWQIDALKQYGCEDIFQEKFTGTTKERPELSILLRSLRKGDTIEQAMILFLASDRFEFR